MIHGGIAMDSYKEYMDGITYRNVDGHYEIFIDGKFECSCDSSELTMTLKEIEKNLRNL